MTRSPALQWASITHLDPMNRIYRLSSLDLVCPHNCSVKVAVLVTAHLPDSKELPHLLSPWAHHLLVLSNAEFFSVDDAGPLGPRLVFVVWVLLEVELTQTGLFLVVWLLVLVWHRLPPWTYATQEIQISVSQTGAKLFKLIVSMSNSVSRVMAQLFRYKSSDGNRDVTKIGQYCHSWSIFCVEKVGLHRFSALMQLFHYLWVWTAYRYGSKIKLECTSSVQKFHCLMAV